jgi:hypothetical protein
MIQFDMAKTFRTVLEAFGLRSIAKEKSVGVTQSIGGTQLSKNLSHTTGGTIAAQDAHSQQRSSC